MKILTNSYKRVMFFRISKNFDNNLYIKEIIIASVNFELEHFEYFIYFYNTKCYFHRGTRNHEKKMDGKLSNFKDFH